MRGKRENKKQRRIKMSARQNYAMELHEKGYNCAQAVAKENKNERQTELRDGIT